MSVPEYAEAKESVVFCEGYHDRDFWAGWLPHLGWTDPGVDAKTGKRTSFKDPFGRPVAGGHFGFAKDGRFVRVQECRGVQHVVAAALERIERRTTHALHHVVVNLDSDAPDGGVGPADARLAGLAKQLEAINGGTAPAPGSWPGCYELGGVLVSGVVWRAADADTPGVPSKQTLERVVAAALAAAYSEKAAGVDLWLKANPRAAVDGRGAILGKAYAWSYMAKWYPEHGRDGFYRHVWNDPAVRAQLEARLRATGAWSIAEAL